MNADQHREYLHRLVDQLPAHVLRAFIVVMKKIILAAQGTLPPPPQEP